MAEHVISQDVIHMNEQIDHVRHQLRPVLVHQLVQHRENIFIEELLSFVENRFDQRLQLVHQSNPRFGKSVLNSMTKMRQNLLYLTIINQSACTFLSHFLHFCFVAAQTVKDVVRNCSHAIINKRSKWAFEFQEDLHCTQTHFYVRLHHLFTQNINEMTARSILHELVWKLNG